MPLSHGTSKKSFVKNLKTELHEGKSKAQSLAIAYSEKKEAEKDHKAEGGMIECPDCHERMEHFCHGGETKDRSAFGKALMSRGEY